MSSYNFIFSLFDNAHEGIAIFHEGKKLQLNPAFKEIFCFNKSKEKEVFSRLFLNGREVVLMEESGNTIPFEDGPVQKLLRKEYFSNTKYRVYDKEFNNEFFCSFSASNISFGEEDYDILYVKDLSDCFNFPMTLKSEKLLLTEILDSIPVMLTIFDPDSDQIYLNRAVEKIVGWTEEDVENYGIMALAYPEEAYRNEVSVFMTSPTVGFKDIIMKTKDGRDIMTSWSNVLIPDGRKIGIGIDINDQWMVEKELKLNEEKFRNLADNISQLAWMSNRNGKISWFNKRWYNYTGVEFEDAKDMGWTRLIHPDHVQRILTHYKASIKSGVIWDDTFPIKNAKGEFRWYLSRALPIKDESDQIISWFGTHTDITEIKNLQRRLQESNLKVVNALQLQKTFIQNISHEVRTPMNSILGFSELLAKNINKGTESEYLESIIYNGKQLMNLIDDILDFSRLDSRELDLSNEIVPLERVFKQMAHQFEALTIRFKKNIELKINIRTEDEDEVIYADEYRLQQVLNNLLSNAVKYTDKGHVEIGYRIQRMDKQILFFVKDSGFGIKENQRDQIFERFKQVQGSETKSIRGTGLGLAISKQLVELFGGEIWFESKPGGGSSFFFTYHYDESLMESAAPVLKPGISNFMMPYLPGRKILIAEDDDFSFRLLEAMLYDTKAEVLHANTGNEALEMFEASQVDIVFLDIRLPGLNGYEIIEKIREKDKNIPVIAQSAYAMPEDKKKSFERGFNFHASKPISSTELYSILNRFLWVKNETPTI